MAHQNTESIVQAWKSLEHNKKYITYPVYKADDNGKAPFFIVLKHKDQEDIEEHCGFKIEYVDPSSSPEAKNVFKSPEYSTAMKNLDWDKGLDEIIHDHGSELLKKHSNLTMVSASPVKSTRHSEVTKTPCIVFYCLKKGYIPYGEEPFPRELVDVPTDVREGKVEPSPCLTHDYYNQKQYNNPLRVGCSISKPKSKGFCTLGGFVNSKTDKGKIGFLTCCHHFIPSKDSMPEIGQEVMQPSNIHSGSDPTCKGKDRKCGIISQAEFQNVPIEERMYGIDAVFVEVDTNCRRIKDGEFAGVTRKQYDEITKITVDFNQGQAADVRKLQNYRRGQLDVFKCGATTGLRDGMLSFVGPVIKFGGHHIQDYSGKEFIASNILEIISKDDHKIFADKGDSGSFVFVKYPQGIVTVIGMYIADTDFGVYLATPIQPILDHFNLEMKNFIPELNLPEYDDDWSVYDY